MAVKSKKNNEKKEVSVEEKLSTLYHLQMMDYKVDEIKRLRGELPLKVQDLEDEVEGLETRIKNIELDIERLNNEISKKKNDIKVAEGLIKKYEEQQMKVRNNREFDSISKEIEFQNLEIELCQKRIKEFKIQLEELKKNYENTKENLDERTKDLDESKGELDSIIGETQKDEEKLANKIKDIESQIEPRLLFAYKRIRTGARNGLAVVPVERDACGGCFNKIPPQRQLDVASRKKVIVCEYCGRILVDKELAELISGKKTENK